MAKIFKPIGLTRDQLSSFLLNAEQIKQFENLFALAETVVDDPDNIVIIDIEAGSAQLSANAALAEIDALAQSTAVDDAALNAKVQQALDAIPSLVQNFDMLALAPLRNNVDLEHDVTGILPFENQTARVRSNQVLTWLSM